MAAKNHSLKSVQDAMIESLGEWGIRRADDDMHGRFFDERVSEVKMYFATTPQQEKIKEWNRLLKKLRKTTLPSDRDEALRYVLKEELDVEDNKVYYDAKDKLGLDFNPYFQRYNNDTKRSEYKLRNEYQKFKKRELDPLQRFDAVEYKAYQWFKFIWFRGIKESLLGNVFEGLLASYLEKEMPCYACKYRNCLRWNGGWDGLSAWADVVCCRTECQAIYEIKSKASDDRVEKGFRYNAFRGGSFRAYYAHPSPGKRFIVIVSRSETHTSQGMAHRVSVAEIDYVLPRLCSKSFIETDRSCRIISEVFPLRSTVRKQWCLLSVCRGDFIRIAKDAYIKRFGEEKLFLSQSPTKNDNNMANKLSQHRPRAPSQTSRSSQEYANELATLKAAVEDLKIRSETETGEAKGDLDDWETMY